MNHFSEEIAKIKSQRGIHDLGIAKLLNLKHSTLRYYKSKPHAISTKGLVGMLQSLEGDTELQNRILTSYNRDYFEHLEQEIGEHITPLENNITASKWNEEKGDPWVLMAQTLKKHKISRETFNDIFPLFLEGKTNKVVQKLFKSLKQTLKKEVSV